MRNRSQYFFDRGVDIRMPDTVYIGPEVSDNAIAHGATIFPGCRLSGKRLSIGPHCEIGREAPATLEDCQFESRVTFNGGFAREAVMLHGAALGSGCHVRPGTLIEEYASGAHAVGLKQTLLMPFVTLGSLINFCDVLMTGGTGPKDHSEVGSSYVHFNFTPHGDKATPSLIGDVPRGVMLKESPVFLGGQGGLVGPARIAFGTVLAAGHVCRRDVETENQLVPASNTKGTSACTYDHRVYRELEARVAKNFSYLGNIIALEEWYRVVRARLITDDDYGKACYEGAIRALALVRNERLSWLEKLVDKVNLSYEILRRDTSMDHTAVLSSHQKYLARIGECVARIREFNAAGIADIHRDRLVEGLDCQSVSSSYTEIIHSLPPEIRAAGTHWLQAVVDEIAALWA